eukprot:CAMPEP_0182912314 /NCGR_PEP_ID=MMETSP0034_2-20130328/37444_1 /TAXON_ID=156128 /ORGANISM="Nephroselmis pyriformis, Strain CCMP717" /LENGTH=540 /DNA_ID=CAMNT_0025048979 /DNA_START=79 /DNA_END=1701 /DNA_ORIENTATION=+
MAELSGVGNFASESSAPGSSMRGVTGKEQVFGGAANAGREEINPVTGQPFDLPVDDEHKATKIKIYSFAAPHMRAFHLSWFSFFISFISTFAAAPMLPIIRNDLDLTKPQLGNAGIAAVTGTIFARVVMGTVCDTYGPRFGHAVLMLGSAPAVFSMSLATGPMGFLAGRLCIGFSLATFVATQFWSSVMFNGKIVGIANATTAGWGNLGGGVTQFLMPVIYSGMLSHGSPFYAWRLAYFVPGCCHILVGVLVLMFSQDLPDGQYKDLQSTGQMAKASGSTVLRIACSNYRMWAMTITYGFCFGVELTMNNVVSSYFFDQFGLDIKLAGLLGSLFGMMNLFARSLGGLASDLMAKKYGMRGRLWCLWLVQTAEGGMCCLMGAVKDSLAATICVMILFSTMVQMAEGASYGVVPFISKRALGVVSGFIGAGGNAGSAITQAIFFKSDKYETYEGIALMGLMIIAMTLLVIPIHFPMWGSMFFGPSKAGVTEEDYYSGDYTEEEIKAGANKDALKFAAASRSQRSQAQKDAAAAVESNAASAV